MLTMLAHLIVALSLSPPLLLSFHIFALLHSFHFRSPSLFIAQFWRYQSGLLPVPPLQLAVNWGWGSSAVPAFVLTSAWLSAEELFGSASPSMGPLNCSGWKRRQRCKNSVKSSQRQLYNVRYRREEVVVVVEGGRCTLLGKERKIQAPTVCI